MRRKTGVAAVPAEKRPRARRLNCAEMAEQLGRSEYKVRKWARIGKIPARKMGQDWQFDPERVEMALDMTYGNAALKREVGRL